jgi:hypothetical protein
MGVYEEELFQVGAGGAMSIGASLILGGPLGWALAAASVVNTILGFGKAKRRRKRYKGARQNVKELAADLQIAEGEKHGTQKMYERGLSAQQSRGKHSTVRASRIHKEGRRHDITGRGINRARTMQMDQLLEAYENASGMHGSSALATGAMNIMMAGVSEAFPTEMTKSIHPGSNPTPAWSGGAGGMQSHSYGVSGNWLPSDHRIKNILGKVGSSPSGLDIYQFTYKGEPSDKVYEGVIAQDIYKTRPEAVRESRSGVMIVNYDEIDVNLVEVQHA